jgi:hypothetical protein
MVSGVTCQSANGHERPHPDSICAEAHTWVILCHAVFRRESFTTRRFSGRVIFQRRVKWTSHLALAMIVLQRAWIKEGVYAYLNQASKSDWKQSARLPP